MDEHPASESRLDKAGHLLMAAGAVAASMGARLIRHRNELLEQVAGDAREAAEAAYHLGRQHERDGIPVPGQPPAAEAPPAPAPPEPA